MLGKLLKHECRATSRVFLPFYGAILFMGLVNRLCFSFKVIESAMSWVAGLAMTTFVLVTIATFVMTFVIMVQRFYRSLLGREGYLMHTLPVKTSLHIWCKALTSLMWTVCTFLAMGISIFIMTASRESFQNTILFFRDIAQFFAKEEIPGFLLIGEALVLVVLSHISSMFMVYASIALGQFVPKHRLAGAFGAYILLSSAVQLITTIFLFSAIGAGWGRRFLLMDANGMIQTVFAFSAGISLLLGAAYYGIARWVLSRRLNLA